MLFPVSRLAVLTAALADASSRGLYALRLEGRAGAGAVDEHGRDDRAVPLRLDGLALLVQVVEDLINLIS